MTDRTTEAEGEAEVVPTTTEIEEGAAPEAAAQPAAEVAAPQAATQAKATKKEDLVQLRDGLILTLIVLLFWFATLYVWLLAHGVRMERFLSPSPDFLQVVAKFDFLGVSPSNPQPSILSLNFEIIMWSIFGVVIRTVYEINLAVRRKRFTFLPALVKLGGDLMLGGGMSEIVILLLRIAHISVGTADLTLAEANYATIAAIAFVLGFYNEDAPRMLARFRNVLIGLSSRSSDLPTGPKG